jgi:hypothetical protein
MMDKICNRLELYFDLLIGSIYASMALSLELFGGVWR